MPARGRPVGRSRGGRRTAAGSSRRASAGRRRRRPARRLHAANLPEMELRRQRSTGVAVGQRVMPEAFVVQRDGLEPCLESDTLSTWPRGYRLSIAYGLWFDPDGVLTLTPRSLEDALHVLEPVPDGADDLMGVGDQDRPAQSVSHIDFLKQVTTVARVAANDRWSDHSFGASDRA
jgi:hypothetical protein